MPPPRVSPATPVVEMAPPVVTRPCFAEGVRRHLRSGELRGFPRFRGLSPTEATAGAGQATLGLE
jgi:hypothetical protein